MDEKRIIPSYSRKEMFKIGDGIADYNWAVLYACIIEGSISVDRVLVKSGLLKIKNKKEDKNNET